MIRRLTMFLMIITVSAGATLTLLPSGISQQQPLMTKEQKMQNEVVKFDPSNRQTFKHTNMHVQGTVQNVSKDTITLKLTWNLHKLDDVTTFACVDDIVSGKLDANMSDAWSYAHEDLKIGDEVTMGSRKDSGKIYAVEIRIQKRPCGKVPPSRNLPWFRPAFFDYHIAKHDYEAGVKVREYELRRLGMLNEAIKLYGKRPGDEKLLAEREPMSDLVPPKVEDEKEKPPFAPPLSKLEQPKLPALEKK